VFPNLKSNCFRTPAELESSLGKIDGVINIPLQELEGRMEELESYRDFQIAVICRVGIRSGKATEILIKNGFKAKNVLGGMTEYRAASNDED
jgi:rhodanese-related sulfurtransferase